MYPPKLSLTVDALSHGKRIDTFLERQLRNYTNWRLQRIIRSGAATIDHMLANQTDRVFRGQAVGTCRSPPLLMLHRAFRRT